MQATQISPTILQEFLESAANAAAKGQSQFFTPIPFGQAIARALPDLRPIITDLNCGDGSLLEAAANKSTERLLGVDIDPCPLRKGPGCRKAKIAADITRLYPLLHEVDWHADLFVLNPPWDLHWHRDRLSRLAESDLPAVCEAYAAHDGRTAFGTIDSTIATLCIALDRSTRNGEGLLIANNATLDRLIFAANAPHKALARHIWARLIAPGNPMTGIEDHAFSEDGTCQTGIIYFARGHDEGVLHESTIPSPSVPLIPSVPLSDHTTALKPARLRSRRGPEIRHEYQLCETTVARWQAVSDEWKATTGKTPRPFNIWLHADGTIQTALSLFDQHSTKVDKSQASRLFKLNGKRPMQLVLQRSEREELLALCNVPQGRADLPVRPPSSVPSEATSPWRVDPLLQSAIRDALREYHSCRAPLYPLPEIQRLGYLEEEDTIHCRRDLSPYFLSDRSYGLSTRSLQVTRTGTRPDLKGETETVEYSGQELAIFITDEEGVPRCFMEGRLRTLNVTLTAPARTRTGVRTHVDADATSIDFTLQQLAEHFVIPEVPDVAALNPEGYAAHLATLRDLESLLSQ